MNIELDELDIKNKYHGIVFYSPKHEVQNIQKAYLNLRNTGRIVMAVNGVNEKIEPTVARFVGAVMRAVIKLPDYTIYIVDKLNTDKQGMNYGEAYKSLVTQRFEVTDLKDVEIDGRFKHKDEV